MLFEALGDERSKVCNILTVATANALFAAIMASGTQN
jgi:hypothetical protein